MIGAIDLGIISVRETPGDVYTTRHECYVVYWTFAVDYFCAKNTLTVAIGLTLGFREIVADERGHDKGHTGVSRSRAVLDTVAGADPEISRKGGI